MDDKRNTDLQLRVYTLASSEAPLAYFELSLDSWAWSSPTYPSPDKCVAALRALLLRLRTAREQVDELLVTKAEGCEIDLLTQAFPDYQPPAFATRTEAEAVLGELCKAAAASTFRIEYLAADLAEENPPQEEKPTPEEDPSASGGVRDLTLIDNYYLDRVEGPEKAGISCFKAEVDERTQYFFQISDSDYRVMLYSEGYESEAGRDKGLRSVLRNLSKEVRFDRCVTPEETYFFRLLAENNQEIARSRPAESAEEVERWIMWLGRQAPEWTLRRKAEEEWEPQEDIIIDFDEEPESPEPEKEDEQPASPKERDINYKLPVKPEVQPSPRDISCGPVFHLLRPFAKDDADRYFGREEDLEEVYDRIFDSRLFVIHGDQATGKTSLVQCGLANRLRETRWDMITIRRDENLNDSLVRELRSHAEVVGCEDLPEECGPEELLHRIYDYSFKSTLLVFDALEDIFMPPIKLEEQHRFFLFLQRLIQNVELSCKVLLLVRDPYLADLTDFEDLVPTLLDHRYHLRHLPARSLPVVVDGLLTNLMAQGVIDVPDPTAVTARISDKLAGNRPEVGLACTQIFLHETYQRSCGRTRQRVALITPTLIDEMGSAAEVTEAYTSRRIEELEAELPKGQKAELTVAQAREIEELVQLQNHCGCPEAATRSTWLAYWHRRGGEKGQLLNLLWLALLGLLLGGVAVGIGGCEPELPSPCDQALQSTSCEDWLNQYCQEEKDSPCAEELRAQLDRENCPIWVDYQSTLAANTCDAFYTYVRTYREEGLCADYFYQLMMSRACATGVDTVWRRDTITIISDTIPINYGGVIVKYRRDTIRISPPPPPDPCPVIDGASTVQLGPIFVMTEDHNGGARYDWVGALNACRSKGPGWRLPCAGEIDFIVRKHYGNSPESAYQNLTGGACPVYPVGRATLAGEFWTMTEANDKQAWSIRFDTENRRIHLIRNRDKSDTLPCRCIYRDKKLDESSDMPDCLDKEVFRNQ